MSDFAPDERLLIKAAHHSPDAFRQLYRLYFQRVYEYAAYRIGAATDVEDVVGEIWLKVVAAFGQFEYRGEGSFKAWLFRIAYHTVTDYYREQRNHVVLGLDEIPDIQGRDLLPDEALALKEQFLHLRGCIQKLSPRRQEIITLRFYGGLRNNEIAAVLDLDERTVAAHLCRAIEDLQRQYMHEDNRA